MIMENSAESSELTETNESAKANAEINISESSNCKDHSEVEKGDAPVEEEVIKSDKETQNNPENVNSSDVPKTTETNAATQEESTSYDVKDIHYEGSVAIYTDPKSGYQYEWNTEKQEWTLKNNVVYGFEDDTHTYTDNDGVKYFWDKEKNAWFPKINDDFMAQYQMNYGFIDNTNLKTDNKKIEEKKVEPKESPEKEPKIKGVKRKPTEPTWFEPDENQNTKVYVSNLPSDITEEEFVDLMQKCGLVMRDPKTGKMKIKLYTEPKTDILKGDALCTYIRIESVDLAIKLLDGYDFKGKKIKVERAKFQMKGAYDPKLKPKMKKRKEKLKEKRMQEKLFDWRPEKMIGERSKHEKVVIVKNVFESSMFDKDVGLILEFQQDLREECSKCGEVRKVIIYDRHPEGIVQVNMSSPEEADECVNLLNKRWFGQRQLTAEIWDGKTKFKIAETDAQISQRLDNWDQFLESDNVEGGANKKQV